MIGMMHSNLIAAIQRLGLECVCCRQIYHPNQYQNDAVEAHLFGTDPFVTCPVCEMNVPDGMRDSEYIKRYRHVIIQQASRPEWMYLLVLYVLMHQTSASASDRVFDHVLRELYTLYPDKSLPEVQVEAERVAHLLRSVERETDQL
jgi:hypothetical protein